MHIIVLADDESNKEFKVKITGADTKVTYIENLAELITNGIDHSSADAFFILKEGIHKQHLSIFEGKPVFINLVTDTLKELELPENFYRINAWPGFINRETWEIAGKENVGIIFEKFQWKYIPVADKPGLVSARIISMIINEAYFALGEGVSSKDEIDIAMKLGTNYPYGPFEWCKKIGLQKMYDLLKKLSETDSRYSIAPAMQNELTTH
ncbi:MAG: 3-hydroxyacyl-CoA dehydrogenase family protein [Ginsengibacter sp.]